METSSCSTELNKPISKRKVKDIRKRLSVLIVNDMKTCSELNVTYIAPCKPKIVKYKSSDSISTADD